MSDASIWQKIGGVIGDSAPVLGGILKTAGNIVPGAGLAGALVDMLGKAFGTTNPDDLMDKISVDPNASSKLIDLQMKFLDTQVQKEQISAGREAKQLDTQRDIYGLDVQDRKRASEREIEIAKTTKNDWIPKFIVIANTLCLLISVSVIVIFHLTDSVVQILALVIGSLLSNFSGLFNYFWGSSEGSKIKDAIRSIGSK